jgi:hypothetical protein
MAKKDAKAPKTRRLMTYTICPTSMRKVLTSWG